MNFHSSAISFGRFGIICGILLIMNVFYTHSLKAQTMQTRKYRVTAYSAANNKVVSQSNVVEVAPAISLYLPNTFTPNGDGLNDQFGATGQGIASYNIKIYNKWGELVFESNDINQKWDGRFHGEQVESNVYVYQVAAKGIAGGAIYKDGTITIIQ